MRYFLPSLLLFLGPINGSAQHDHSHDHEHIAPHPHMAEKLQYVENHGQWDPSVLFRAGFSGAALFLQNDGVFMEST